MEMIKKVPPLVCKGEKNLTFYHNGKLMITPGKIPNGYPHPLDTNPHTCFPHLHYNGPFT
jgi:hypothetical protein